MGYGDDIKNKKMFNRVAELVINQESSLIVGAAGRRDEPSRDIWLWSLEDGKLKEVIKITEPLIKDYKYSPSYTKYGIEREGLSSKVEYVKRIAISHDGKLIAVSFFTLTVGCYSLEDKKWLWTVKWVNGERHSPEELRFTRDNKKLIAVGEKNTVIYDAKTGDILERQTDPLSDYDYIMSPTTRAVLSSSGRYLVTWHIYPMDYGVLRRLFMNKKVTVWDIEENKLIARWKKPEQNLCNAIFTPDEKYIVFSSCEGFLSEWSISEQKMLREWQVGDWLLYGGYLTFSPDGRFFAFENSGDIRIWDYTTGKLIHEYSNKEAGVGMSSVDVYPMAFSPDSKYFALEKDGQLCLYDTETWKEKWCVLSYTEGQQISEGKRGSEKYISVLRQ